MSTTTSDKLSCVRSKIERAKQHIANLDGALRAFYGSKPYAVGVKHDPNTRKLIYYVAGVAETPKAVLFFAGDAIQNLRSALDHLAFKLWEAGVYCPGTAESHVSFSIFDSPEKFKTNFQGIVKGSRQSVIDALGAIEPYKGGKGHQLWILNKLNNIDKHRELLTVGSAFRSMNLGAVMTASKWWAQTQAEWQSRGHDLSAVVFDSYIRPADRMCPLKVGDELFIDAPDAEVNEKMDFRFEVALAEPQIAEGEPLLETIHHIANLVDQIIVPFGSLL
jgi:hypothetical protein